MTQEKIITSIYLNKSVKILKIYLVIIAAIILLPAFIKPLLIDIYALFDLIFGLLIISLLFLIPLGLIYSIKSIKRKEGNRLSRNKYFFIHLLFCLGYIILILKMILDIREFLYS